MPWKDLMKSRSISIFDLVISLSFSVYAITAIMFMFYIDEALINIIGIIAILFVICYFLSDFFYILKIKSNNLFKKEKSPEKNVSLYSTDLMSGAFARSFLWQKYIIVSSRFFNGKRKSLLKPIFYHELSHVLNFDYNLYKLTISSFCLLFFAYFFNLTYHLVQHYLEYGFYYEFQSRKIFLPNLYAGGVIAIVSIFSAFIEYIRIREFKADEYSSAIVGRDEYLNLLKVIREESNSGRSTILHPNITSRIKHIETGLISVNLNTLIFIASIPIASLFSTHL